MDILEPEVGDVDLIEVVGDAPGGYTVRLSSGMIAHLPSKQVAWSPSSVRRVSKLKHGFTTYAKVTEIRPKKQGAWRWIEVSMRALLPDPWEQVEQLYPIGCLVKARLSVFTPFGAMFELPGGVSILLHNSEVSWIDSNASASQLFEVGQLIEMLVIESSNESRRLSSSYRALLPDPNYTLE